MKPTKTFKETYHSIMGEGKSTVDVSISYVQPAMDVFKDAFKRMGKMDGETFVFKKEDDAEEFISALQDDAGIPEDEIYLNESTATYNKLKSKFGGKEVNPKAGRVTYKFPDEEAYNLAKKFVKGDSSVNNTDSINYTITLEAVSKKPPAPSLLPIIKDLEKNIDIMQQWVKYEDDDGASKKAVKMLTDARALVARASQTAG